MAELEITFPKLDRSRPFGIVTPPWENAHFEQGGFHFDVNGDVVKELITDELEARLQKDAARAKADQAAEKARKEALKKLGLDPNDPDLATKALDAVASGAATTGAGSDDVDLIAWAKAEKQYPFTKVRGALAAEHNFLATDARAAVAFLVDNGKIEADQVKVKSV